LEVPLNGDCQSLLKTQLACVLQPHRATLSTLSATLPHYFSSFYLYKDVKKTYQKWSQTWSITAALLDELDDLEVAGALGSTLLVLGGAGVHADIGFTDLLDH